MEVCMKSRSMLVAALVIGLIFIGVSAVTAGGDKNRGEIGAGSTWENGCEDQPCVEDPPKPGSPAAVNTQAVDAPAALDEAQIRHLQFVREEEKMARDVYHVLYEKWGNPVFATIEASEQAHMDALANLLCFYGIDDPVASDEVGAFSNADLAQLFEDLTNWGSQSEIDALLAGGFIEEIDILDIWAAFAETDEERIQNVYQNLYEGSYNHLHAFVRHYELLSPTAYEPQQLSKTEFDLVMAFVTPAEHSRQGRQKKGK